MKNLIILLLLFIPFSFFAQEKPASDKQVSDDQTNQWMTKIASDSEMRSVMMEMLIKKTTGNEEEMMKLVKIITNNPEMNKMISGEKTEKMNNTSIRMEPIGMRSDSSKMDKNSTEPMKMYKKK